MLGYNLGVRYTVVMLKEQREGQDRWRHRWTTVVLAVRPDEVLVAEHLVALTGEPPVEAELLSSAEELPLGGSPSEHGSSSRLVPFAHEPWTPP